MSKKTYTRVRERYNAPSGKTFFEEATYEKSPGKAEREVSCREITIPEFCAALRESGDSYAEAWARVVERDGSSTLATKKAMFKLVKAERLADQHEELLRWMS